MVYRHTVIYALSAFIFLGYAVYQKGRNCQMEMNNCSSYDSRFQSPLHALTQSALLCSRSLCKSCRNLF
jgi:hypothetical protein